MASLQKWLTKATVKDRYSIPSDRQLAEMQGAGFPRPHYFGPRSPRWHVDELDEFDRKVLAGEARLVDPNAASAQTERARAVYMARVANGEVRASRKATAARKRRATARADA